MLTIVYKCIHAVHIEFQGLCPNHNTPPAALPAMAASSSGSAGDAVTEYNFGKRVRI